MRASISNSKGAFGTLGRWSINLTISKETVSATLVREEEKVQWPVYYMNKRLLDAKTQYPELEKLALALVITSRKLRTYFHAHSIEFSISINLKNSGRRHLLISRTTLKIIVSIYFIHIFTLFIIYFTFIIPLSISLQQFSI